MMCRRSSHHPILLRAAYSSLLALGILSISTNKSLLFSQAYPEEDLVTSLPLYGSPPTPHYSGYLDASAGCDTEKNGTECKLHYWFATSSNPDQDDVPVLLWLNGGPGSSSLLGFLQELGPLVMNADGGLMDNPWSWTKHAHVLALEAPVGVGFSYCSRSPCNVTDRTMARAARAALEDFFGNKFTELADLDFYIAGESYAGVYVPTLAKEILDSGSGLPLKGLLVGDPCTDDALQSESMNSMWYANKHGLMDPHDYEFLTNNCELDVSYNLMPRGAVHGVVNEFNAELLQIEDLDQRRIRAEELYHSVVTKKAKQSMRKNNTQCALVYRKFLFASSGALSQGWRHLYVNDYSLFSLVTSQEDNDQSAYLNRPDVRKALHVDGPDAPGGWDLFASSSRLRYFNEYRACNWNKGGPLIDKSMVDFYREIVPRLDRVWIYNGDTDPCVSYEGTREAVKRVGLPEVGHYRPWFYRQHGVSLNMLKDKSVSFGPDLTVSDVGVQFGGEVVDYSYDGDDGESRLSFLTVHGSGHMVPQFRPQAAEHLVKMFLSGEPLSPLLPDDELLKQATQTEFAKIMDTWTLKAQSPSYVGTSKKMRHVAKKTIM